MAGEGDAPMQRWIVIGMLALLGSGMVRAIELPDAPQFVPMTSADGLPSTYVNAMAEDATGYLWIGTQDGLARYDGVEFAIYQHAVDDPTTLPANAVQVLHVDAMDRVWAGVEGGGISMLDADRAGFRRYSPATDPRIEINDVWAITSQDDGVVWFGGYAGGLYRVDPRADTVEIFRADPAGEGGLPADHVLDLMWLPDGRLFVATSGGLAILRDGVFEPVPPFHHPRPGMAISLFATADGEVWVGTQSGLERLVGDRFQPVFEDEEGLAKVEAGVSRVISDRNGGYWIGTRAGLRYARDGRVRDISGYASLGGVEYVHDMLEDHEGGLWFAIRNVGLIRLPPDWNNFSVLREGRRIRGGLHSNNVFSGADDMQGGLWLIHRDGVLEHVSPDGKVRGYFDTEETRLPIRTGSAVLVRNDARLWLGHARGLSRFDPASGKVEHWYADDSPDAPPRGLVDILRHAPDGDLWLSAYGAGVQHRDPDGKVLRTWLIGDADGLPEGSVEDLVFGPDGRPWLAGDSGVLRLDDAGERFVAVAGIEGRLMSLAFSREGDLWVARPGFIERHALEDGAAVLRTRIGRAQGLPTVEVGGMLVDADDDVWVTSSRGLWRYASDGGTLRQFGVRDGLPSDEFTANPPLITENGVVVASTNRGVVVFDPQRIRVTRTKPRLVLDEVSVLRPDGRVEMVVDGPLKLTWADRELTIKARLLSFVDAPSNRYRFRLRGFDSQWKDVDARGERMFTQLPPGQYVLEIVGGNASDVWSAKPLRLPVHVAAPWWQSRWAYVLYVSLALLSLAAGILLYRARLTRRHQLELAQRQREWAERASQAKSTFLATMGHEIRTPMTGVLGMTELLMRSSLDERQRGYVDAIRRSGDLMLRLVNDALDLARIEAGKLTLADEVFDLHAVMEQVERLMRPLAERKGLRLTLLLADAAPRWVRGDSQRVQQIVLNLASNAVKFTEQGEVTLTLDPALDAAADDARTGGKGGSGIAVSVRDTGPGLDAEQQSRLYQRFEQAEGHLTARRHGGSGLGLSICQELAGAMGGRIRVTSAPGQGSTFRFEAPLAFADAPQPRSQDVMEAVEGRDILLVEDDSTVAEVVVGLLEAQGHRVAHAPHGLAALAELRSRRYALVFMDLDLPGLNGFEIARLIVASGDAPPIVALTARADASAEDRARAAGMQGFMRKPVRSDDLADVVRQFVRP